MTNSNRIKLTWISFLSYALTGALVIVTGMVMGNIADYFNLPVSSMSNTFTFLNAGILISIFLNAWRCSRRRCSFSGWSAASPCRLVHSW